MRQQPNRRQGEILLLQQVGMQEFGDSSGRLPYSASLLGRFDQLIVKLLMLHFKRFRNLEILHKTSLCPVHHVHPRLAIVISFYQDSSFCAGSNSRIPDRAMVCYGFHAAQRTPRCFSHAITGCWRMRSPALPMRSYDRPGCVAWLNDAFCRLTGYTAEEVLGRTPSFLKSGRQDGGFYRALWQTVLAGQA